MLGSITSELDKLSPRFEVNPAQIQILQSPSEFYETLKVSSAASHTNTILLGQVDIKGVFEFSN